MLKTILHNCTIGKLIVQHSCRTYAFVNNINAKNISTNSKYLRPILQDSTEEENKPGIDQDKKLKIIQLEADIARQEGRRVPDADFFKPEHWEHLLSLNSRSARTRYYSFLWQIEKKKLSREVKKIKNVEALNERKSREREESEYNNHIIYGIGHTSLFLRIYDTTINHWQNNKLTRAMQFGEKIVLDCSYDDQMTRMEQINTAKQLMLCFAQNRLSDEPFDLHFCNANFNVATMKYLEKHIPTMRNAEFPMNLSESCFTEIFPRDKIVYLTPHCRNELKTYDPDDVYVIGAIVDKSNNEPVSLAKAKKLNLRMAKLPIDRYLSWNAGSGKSLTLNQMIDILLDLKKFGDWNHALRHVPKRKVYESVGKPTYNKRREHTVTIRSKKLDFDIEKWGNRDSKNKFKD